MKNFVWWTGVVENRDDPERLGRCQVRIFGYHTEDTNLLPTADLPWAIPLQPITSAATSGIGSAPVGIVTGAWVTGWFLDGEQAQQPIIMGTIAGNPTSKIEAKNKEKIESTESNTIKDTRGNAVYDSNNNPRKIDIVTTDAKNQFVPLKPKDLDTLLSALGNSLSENNYGKVGTNGELGKYQFTTEQLVDLGYVFLLGSTKLNRGILDDPSFWTGQENIKSKEQFLSNINVQENAMLSLTKSNYDTLKRIGKIKESDSYQIISGLLAAAHIIGPFGADDLGRKDANGKRVQEYFILGNSALGGTAEEYIAQADSTPTYISKSKNFMDTNKELAKIKGFEDPAKLYPSYDYRDHSDINKLALGETTHPIFNNKRNKKIERIPLARSTETWSEPEPAYGGRYPFNQVIETEAGHIIEIDSTPNAERIHVYHKQGTYFEIDVNGSMIRKVTGENYEIIDRNNFVYVKGANHLTVEGRTTIYVKDDASIQVDGDLDVTSHGSALIQAAGSAAIVADSAILSAKNSLDISSEGAINIQGKSINLYADGGDLTVKSSNDMALQSGAGGTLSVNGGIDLLLNAAIIKNKMGGTSIRGIDLPVLTPPEKKTPDKTQIPVLTRQPPDSEATFANDSLGPDAESYAEERESDGQISRKIKLMPVVYNPASKKNEPALLGEIPAVVTRKVPAVAVDCTDLKDFNNNFPPSLYLSDTIQLKDLVKAPHALGKQTNGLSNKDIVCNLLQLCTNVVEPVKQAFPGMRFNSGFRSPYGKETDPKDHGLGAALDVSWPGKSFEYHAKVAEWIVRNVPYRQVILEYETVGYSNGNPTTKIAACWIHLALLLDNRGNVIPARTPVFTMLNHGIYISPDGKNSVNKFIILE
jgi:hypothetical protein